MSRPVFISFTATLRLIAQELVTKEQLDNGIFFFGCAREHAENPADPSHSCNEVEWLGERGPSYHSILWNAVLNAEKHGRCSFRKSYYDDQWELLCELLKNDGYENSELVFDYWWDNDQYRKHYGEKDYSYPLAEEFLTSIGYVPMYGL